MKECKVYKNFTGKFSFELEDVKTNTFDDLLKYIKEFNNSYIDPFDVLPKDEYERLLDADELDFKELEIRIISKDLIIEDYILIDKLLFDNWMNNYTYFNDDFEMGMGSPVSIHFNFNSA